MQIPIVNTKGRHIDLAPWPSHISEDGVLHFQDNGRPEYQKMRSENIKPDIVILATGYKQTFPFFEAKYPSASDADVRGIWKRDDSTIGFIGFVRPGLGAIPPLSEMQAQLWILNLIAPNRITHALLPKDEHHYRILPPPGARINYGVEHESYAYQLGVDIGCAAGFWEVLAIGWKSSLPGGWYKIPLVWAVGSNYNAKFRLRGPWQWDDAEKVLAVELWDTITRRGGLMGKSFLPLWQ
jgi:dimethylaniline monooxygenase (N-oxide forming)